MVVKIVKKKDLQAILGEYRVRLEGVRAGAWSVRAGIFRRIFGLGERERNEGAGERERNEGESVMREREKERNEVRESRRLLVVASQLSLLIESKEKKS